MSTGRLLWGLRWEQIIYTCFAHAFALIVGYKKQPRYNLRWMSDKGHEDVMASKQKSKRFSELKKMKKQLINRLSSTRSGYLEMYCSKKLREDLNNLMFELMGWFFWFPLTVVTSFFTQQITQNMALKISNKNISFSKIRCLKCLFVVNFVSIYWV